MLGLLIFLVLIVLFIWWGMRERDDQPFDSDGLERNADRFAQPTEGKGFTKDTLSDELSRYLELSERLKETSRDSINYSKIKKKLQQLEVEMKKRSRVAAAMQFTSDAKKPAGEDKRKLRKRDKNGRYIKKS